MALAGGLGAQLGAVDEVTYGTSPVVSKFFEFDNETVKQSIERLESSGLRPNRRVLATNDRLPGRVGAAGDIQLEVQNQGFGFWLKHMMGSIASSQPNVGSAPTVWEHKATVGPLDGKSFTTQIGRPDNAGTSQPFTYAGGKIDKWEISCDVNGFLTAKLSPDYASESTGVGLAAASYPTNLIPLQWLGGAITIGGVANDVEKFSLAGDNGLKSDRYFIRATTPAQKKEQLEGAQLRAYTGSVDVEWSGLTNYNKFVNGTIGALTGFFSGGSISGAYNFALEITLAAVQFDGDTPNVGGPNIISHSLPFKVLDSNVTDGPVAIVYRTTDTTP